MKALQYVDTQKRNRQYAMQMLPYAVSSMFNPVFGALEFLGGQSGILYNQEQKRNWSQSQNRIKRRLGKIAGSDTNRIFSNISGITADTGLALLEPGDVLNNVELSADILKLLGDFNVFKRIPKYGTMIDKGLDYVGKGQNINDGILKPIYKTIEYFTPDWVKQYASNYDKIRQINNSALMNFNTNR